MEHLNTVIISEYTEALGKDVFLQTLSLYEQQATNYFTDLATAIDHNDKQAWQKGCHTMKSAAGNMGLKALHQLLGDMEYTCANQQHMTDKLAEAKQLNNECLVQLKQFLA
ncbi:Hpt domain-containing protein [Thalassotalea maritima]|uniref:Hpt domain-containing protein n=1 Tax=Thalassotalea maritima TaxID=3242416 RepID=UPI003526E135